MTEFKIVHLLAANVGSYVTYRSVYDRMHYVGFIAGAAKMATERTSALASSGSETSSVIDPHLAEIDNYQSFGYRWARPKPETWGWRQAIRRLAASLTLKSVVLVGIFVALPVVLYGQFESADRQMRDLVTRAIQDRSALIAEALAPKLTNGDKGAWPRSTTISPNIPATARS